MSVISNIEAIVSAVGRWQPSDVAFIRSVSFENQIGHCFDLILHVLIQPRLQQSTGWPDITGEFWEASIAFRSVRDLVLTICGPWDIPTPGFGLDDIRDRQWEGQNLLVYDFEHLTNDGIRFGAKSAEVLSCQHSTQRPFAHGIWRQFPGVNCESSASDDPRPPCREES